MLTRGTRRLRDGREVDVGRNDGLRKVCRCGRHKWPKCPHPWHFSFQWNGEDYRFSLERHVGRKLTKTEADAEAERLRTTIRAGEFQTEQKRPSQASPPQTPPVTFRQFSNEWRKRRGYQLVHAGDNDSRLKLLCAFVIPGTEPAMMFGDKPVAEITDGDIEAYRHHRRTQRRSAVTINHDLKLLRKMFAWGIRERLLPGTPFRVAGESVIRLDPESPREERLTDSEKERRLLEAAGPHLRGVITAMLETCCRPGEILSLQWQDVDLGSRELTIRAAKTKTRFARRLPISNRLLAVLEMRRLDPVGRAFPPDAYVFGNRLGERVKSVQTAWTNARNAAGLGRLQLRDLRHEAASRFEEAGVLTTDVSRFLGHRDLTTTTRYLNTTSRRLRLALQRVEDARAHSEAVANSCKDAAESEPLAGDAEASPTPSKSLPS